MHHIYRHAERVLVWLGEEYDNSTRVFTVLRLYEQLLAIVEDIEMIIDFDCIDEWQAQFATLRGHGQTQTEKEELRARYFSKWTKERFDQLQHFFHQTNEHGISPNMFSMIARFAWERDGLRMLLSSDIQPTCYSPRERKAFLSDWTFVDGAVSLVNRPWFSRLWTYQEIILAKSSIILCGEDFIDWETLQCFRQIVNDRYGPLSSNKTHWLVLGSERAFTSPLARGFDVDVEKKYDNFLEVVKNLSCRQTRDPRDYFYGVAGMIAEQRRSRMTIDYRLPVVSVFRTATKMLCGPQDSLRKADASRWCELKEFYGGSYIPKFCVSGLPTWCIDFSSRAGIRWEPHEFPGFSEKACKILRGSEYHRKLLAEASRFGRLDYMATRATRTIGLRKRVTTSSFGPIKIDDIPIDVLAKYTPRATKGDKAKKNVRQAGKVAFDNAGRMSIAGVTLDIVQTSTSMAAGENMLDFMDMETLPTTRSFYLRSYFNHIYNEDNRKWFRDITDVFNLDKWQADKIAQTWLMNYVGRGDVLEEKGRLFEEIRAAHDIIEKSGRSPWEAMTHQHPLRKDEYLGLFGESPASVNRDLNKDKVAVTELTEPLAIQVTENVSTVGEDMGLPWSMEVLETHLDSSEGHETDSGDDLSSVGFVSIDACLENTIAEQFEKVFQMEAGGFKQAYLSNLPDESDPYAFQKLFEEIGQRLEDVKKQLDGNTHSDVDPNRQKDILVADIRYQRMSQMPLVTKLSHLFKPVAEIEGRLRARYFFKTKAGRIGWSMQPTQPGDRICYLDGANYPHIISSDGRRHLTCGAVEGMMGDDILKYVDGRNHWDNFRFE